MRTVMQLVVSWFFRNFLSFLVIVGILVAGVYLQKEITDWSSLTTDIYTLENVQQNLDRYLQNAKDETSNRIAQLEKASENALSKRIATIDKEIERKELELKKLGGLPSLLMGGQIGSGIATRFKLDLEIDLLRQEREHLVALHAGLLEPIYLEKLRKRHKAAFNQLTQNEGEQANLKATHPVRVLVFGTTQYFQLTQLKATHKQLELDNESAYGSYKRQEDRIKFLKAKAKNFKIQEDQIDNIVRPLSVAIEERKNSAQENWITKFSQPVINVVPTALLILLGVILAPIAIKAFFYFVLAPIAARRPAFSILPGASGIINSHTEESNSHVDQARFTSVSQRITLDQNEDLLILPEYLQSSPVNAAIDTKWLLDWSLPISSLASGMVALSRIRCDAPCLVVVSSTKDPFSEVGMLTLPNSSAIVFQPRSMVGVVYRNDVPLRITKHWRLASLHAWLTLQFRYVVFHGPSKLIVKGCRGARIEESNTARRINQAATMGFSANLSYSTIRCETFMSYLSGEQELFQDQFAGAPGVYVYEEMPHFGQKKGLTGRGIQGVIDSLLKIFGI